MIYVIVLIAFLTGCASTQPIESFDCTPQSTKCYAVSMEFLEAYIMVYEDRDRLKKAVKTCQERM